MVLYSGTDSVSIREVEEATDDNAWAWRWVERTFQADPSVNTCYYIATSYPDQNEEKRWFQSTEFKDGKPVKSKAVGDRLSYLATDLFISSFASNSQLIAEIQGHDLSRRAVLLIFDTDVRSLFRNGNIELLMMKQANERLLPLTLFQINKGELLCSLAQEKSEEIPFYSAGEVGSLEEVGKKSEISESQDN